MSTAPLGIMAELAVPVLIAKAPTLEASTSSVFHSKRFFNDQTQKALLRDVPPTFSIFEILA